ncbi:hypothetical protein MUBE_13620 [Mycobacterium uberis]|uniref:Uncharacterized protein n=1 Tax=Mycobacterium uberis TaxID=2162698 RepID=A0A3E1HDS9_9MYCO|nr:hypothetical protein [Mycobacterium uberis]RFD24593.1 hypothetical protein MUBE_13620 [Mycobacterium uberis]
MISLCEQVGSGHELVTQRSQPAKKVCPVSDNGCAELSYWIAIKLPDGIRAKENTIDRLDEVTPAPQWPPDDFRKNHDSILSRSGIPTQPYCLR